MLLSFNPAIDGDRFIWNLAPWDAELLAAIKKAQAIVLPQTVTREFYRLCKENCAKVFPNYDMRCSWEGKVGDTLLFWTFGVAHPRTMVFPRLESMVNEHPEMMAKPILPDFPFVIKGACGGEGRYVWLVKCQEDFDKTLARLKKCELEGVFGFVIQEYLPGLKRDLRVVVIGDEIISYWRNREGFFHNVSKGGTIDFESDPHLQKKGREAVHELCVKTGINLAGFDLIFADPDRDPLFLEINYTFGRVGLGGSEAFYTLLEKEVKNWLAK
ncbi:MAG: glutathione synthase [Proteobacteria bacterium]|nr:glutathione synthase [Pseudomonadota bacterium]MBU1138320.1 glutathione synthase [Pseudomonadota bacterium]MBU1233472.1 glutathione synthase [Pseudomonadota bacterium]MBU1419002.1 glutathione synthase [Pseudomonadota bacterium]MBU1455070.1 glutathione synthase [Pseudomonadota bacterium]